MANTDPVHLLDGSPKVKGHLHRAIFAIEKLAHVLLVQKLIPLAVVSISTPPG
jgi:hypothetical protein